MCLRNSSLDQLSVPISINLPLSKMDSFHLIKLYHGAVESSRVTVFQNFLLSDRLFLSKLEFKFKFCLFFLSKIY